MLRGLRLIVAVFFAPRLAKHPPHSRLGIEQPGTEARPGPKYSLRQNTFAARVVKRPLIGVISDERLFQRLSAAKRFGANTVQKPLSHGNTDGRGKLILGQCCAAYGARR